MIFLGSLKEAVLEMQSVAAPHDLLPIDQLVVVGKVCIDIGKGVWLRDRNVGKTAYFAPFLARLI